VLKHHAFKPEGGVVVVPAKDNVITSSTFFRRTGSLLQLRRKMLWGRWIPMSGLTGVEVQQGVKEDIEKKKIDRRTLIWTDAPRSAGTH